MGGAMAPVVAPAAKNKNLPLIIGVGCAALFLFSLCASTALFLILRS
jgi:hypothetical protein